MPFDGVAVEIPRIALEKIERVFALLRTADQWCQGAMERDGGRRCLVGAMRAAHAELLLERPILHSIMQETGHSYRRIESFNDSKATTHALVLKVLTTTRENLRNGTDGGCRRPV